MKKILMLLILCFSFLGCDNTDDGPFSWSKRNGANILVTINNEPVNGTVEFSKVDYMRNITLTTAKVKLKNGLPCGEWQVFNKEGSLILEGDGEWEIINGISMFDGTIKVTNYCDVKDIKLKGRFNIDIIHFENMGINLSLKGDSLFGLKVSSIDLLLGKNGIRAVSLKDGTTITKTNGNTVTFKNNHIVELKDEEKGNYIEISEKADKNNLYDISFVSKHIEKGNYIIEAKTKGTLNGKLSEAKIDLSKDTVFATYDEEEDLIDESKLYYVKENYNDGIYSYELLEQKYPVNVSLSSDSFGLYNFSIKNQYANLVRENEKLVMESKKAKREREEQQRIYEEERRRQEAEDRERARIIRERELEIKRQEKEMRDKFHNTKMEYNMDLMNY